jgi:magnesium transporter
MSPEMEREPWVILEERAAAGDREGILEFLSSLPVTEKVLAVSRMRREAREALFRNLDAETLADLLEPAPESQAADLIEELSPERGAAVLGEMRSDMRADILAEIKPEEAGAILRMLPQEEAEEIRHLADYRPDTAGGLMVTEFLSFPESRTVGDILDDIRQHGEEYSDLDVQYAHVVDEQGQLTGILPLRDLLFAKRSSPLPSLMIPKPFSVRDTAPLEELVSFFSERPFVGIPVVDAEDRLVGVVRRASVRDAVSKSSTSIFLKFSGIIGGEELRTLPLHVRSGRRLSWLSINIVLNIIAASVIAMYQETLAAAIALTVFLPMISDMSGCSGNQAVAVSMRELTLGLVRPRELMRVILKESSVGVINGVALGLLLGAVAFLWKGNPYLGFVVGVALAANTLIAVTLGGALPLILKRFKFDPALVSGPILTTVTDMCGFFIVLSLATVLLPLLATA